MEIISVRLSTDDRQYVDSQSSNRSAFIRGLIHQHREHKAAQPLLRELRRLLDGVQLTEPAAAVPHNEQERALRLMEQIFSKEE